MLVRIFRDLPQENRTSMELYADALEQFLQKVANDVYKIESYQPRMIQLTRFAPFLPLRKKLDNYYSRFFYYPRYAQRIQGDINHIVDQGYGHLLYKLDPKRTVVTCHDLILLKLKSGEIERSSPRIATKMFEYSIRAMCRAAAIIANSNSTKQDIIQYTSYPPDKIKIIYNGLDPSFQKIEDKNLLEKIKNKYSLKKKSAILLHVGSCALYKNIETILCVLSVLVHEMGVKSVLIKVGDKFTVDQQRLINELGLTRHVVYLGKIPREDLVAIYNIADIFVYPSLYEGFGWPVLEAMACGTPVVISNFASLPEIAGDAAIMVNPSDPEEIAKAVHMILTNEELRLSLITKGLRRASQFTWEKTAEKVLEVYEEAHRLQSEERKGS